MVMAVVMIGVVDQSEMMLEGLPPTVLKYHASGAPAASSDPQAAAVALLQAEVVETITTMMGLLVVITEEGLPKGRPHIGTRTVAAAAAVVQARVQSHFVNEATDTAMGFAVGALVFQHPSTMRRSRLDPYCNPSLQC